MSRFGYGDLVMAAGNGGSDTVASVRSLGSGGSVIRLRSPLGDEATQVHSQGSPMGKDGLQVSRLTTGDGGAPLGNKATQVYYRGSLLGKGHRRRKRRHRRLHKCTTLNHHSFARSLASALSRFTIGEGGVTGAPRCAMVRSLADSPIHVPRPATEMRAETNSATGARC